MGTKVSVVVPVSGADPHLWEAVASLRRQSRAPPEVVVVHSGDEDEVARGLPDAAWCTYANVPARGPAAARNRGIDLASGDVIGFCDADDWWHPEKLARQLPVLHRTGADLVYADEYLRRDGRLHRIDSLPVRDPETHHVDYFRNGGGVGSRTVLARAEAFERERFDDRFGPREDPHLWTRLFAAFRPARVPEALSYKRADSASVSADVDRACRMERLEVADLVARFPELEPYRAARDRKRRLRYAKRLLSEDDRGADARRVLAGLVRGGHLTPRVAALLVLALLPAGNRTATRTVQRVLWRLRATRDRNTAAQKA